MEETANVPGKRSFLFIFLASCITLGFYWLYWYYKTNQELKDQAKIEISPFGRLALLVFGFILLGLPSLYAYYIWLRDVNDQAKKAGLDGFSPIIHIILLFVPLGALYTTYRVQATLNGMWDKAMAVSEADGKAKKEDADEKPAARGKGETVLVVCPRCKTRNSESANYCVKCGEKVQG